MSLSRCSASCSRPADSSEHFQAVHAWHPEIHQDHVRPIPLHQPQAPLPVAHDCDPIALILQDLAAALAYRLFVVDDENG